MKNFLISSERIKDYMEGLKDYMEGIKDYAFQNIVFVHDFAFIYLIFVFLMIIAYFIGVLYEYSDIAYAKYFRLFKWDYIIPMTYWMKFLAEEILILRNNKDTKKMRLNRRVMGKWRHNYYHEFIATRVFARYLGNILNQAHNLRLEILWTFLPITIILELIFPSLSLIAEDELSSRASIHTINVIGHQWYWVYELNGSKGISIVKNVSQLVLPGGGYRRDRKMTRLLATTSSVSLPVGLKTSFYITSNDVAHSWAIPGLGLKIDAIPGRINLKTVLPSKVGVFSGMCSEICGIEHGFMPISLKVSTFSKWSYNMEHLGADGHPRYVNTNNVWFIFKKKKK
jgi:heme/copper-type cytochrome/quinol oxidase subunit 2